MAALARAPLPVVLPLHPRTARAVARYGVEVAGSLRPVEPSCVLTNVSNPRAQVNRRGLYERTTIRRGATVGANATVLCGATLGRYCFVAAGAVVTGDVPDYGLVVGASARRVGWMSRHGHRLTPDADGVMVCPETGYRYREEPPGVVRCLDLDEDAPLPEDLATGSVSYRDVSARKADATADAFD